VEGGGSEDSIAFGGAEAGEGEARDATSISIKFECVYVRYVDIRYLLLDCLADRLGDDGRNERVRDARCPFFLSIG
jgi:hypothetical protein